MGGAPAWGSSKVDGLGLVLSIGTLQVVSSYALAPTALFVLKKDNLVRKPLIRLIRIKVFDWFMLTVILANCVTLAMGSNKPGFDESTTGQALAMSNYVFVALFIFEAACKIIALGFVFAEHTYLRSGETAVPCTSCHALALHAAFWTHSMHPQLASRFMPMTPWQAGTYSTLLWWPWASWSSRHSAITPSSAASGL